jgi:hypothetical protein
MSAEWRTVPGYEPYEASSGGQIRRGDRIEEDAWQVADVLDSAARQGFRRAWLTSIKTFNAKLDVHEVKEAAEIAFAKKPYSDNSRFKYFCGICWSKIKEASGG